MFKPVSLYFADGYKVGHRRMLAKGTTRLAGTWIPRSVKYAPGGIKKIVSAGQQLVVRWLHDEFQENFFSQPKAVAVKFAKDMSMYLGMDYDGAHFEALHELGYLPIRIKSLPEGIETLPNIPHMTFINTVDGFAWLTLYLETIISSLAWKPSTSATIALQYRRNCVSWIMKTCPEMAWLIPYLCHDFSARGLSPWDMLSSGLGHAMSFEGSDSIICIPGARYFYNNKLEDGLYESTKTDNSPAGCYGYFKIENGEITGIGEELTRDGGWVWISGHERLESAIETLKDWPNLYKLAKDAYEYQSVCIRSVNASEHSVSTTKIFTVGEQQMIADWLIDFPTGILSIVADTFDLWKLITEYLPANKEAIMARDGKLVIRPDSGNPVDIICGKQGYEIENDKVTEQYFKEDHGNGSWRNRTVNNVSVNEVKGVIELLWDIFGGTVNEQGYKVLDPHIGAIYGDSITLDRQIQIYERLAAKGFAACNIVLGVGSFTYQMNTRDTFGFAAKGSWFEVEERNQDDLFDQGGPKIGDMIKVGYDIYKDPITDDGTKKSLKGLMCVTHENGEYVVHTQCTPEQESTGLLQTIYENGKLYNQVTLAEIRKRIASII
jgi:nicotinamide phosphoribosyltransferase